MKRTRSFRLVAAGVVVALTSAVAVSTTTQTASANDFQIIQDNLDDALGVLLEGVGAAAETYLATQSFQDAGGVLVEYIFDSGAALIAGTAQFGALGLGFTLLQSAVMNNIDPFLAALDDPALAAELFTADDLALVAENLIPAVITALEGDPVLLGVPGGVLSGLGHAVEGDLIAPGPLGLLLGAGSTAVSDIFFGILGGAYVLTDEYNMGILGPLATGLSTIGLVGFGAADGFAGAYIQSVQGTLQSLLQTAPLNAVTAPLASLLSGFSIPALPIPLP